MLIESRFFSAYFFHVSTSGKLNIIDVDITQEVHFTMIIQYCSSILSHKSEVGYLPEI